MTGTRRGSALSPVLVFTAAVVAVVSSLGAPLLPGISAQLHVPLSTAQWSLTITLLVGTISSPIMGRLGDMPHAEDHRAAGLDLRRHGNSGRPPNRDVLPELDLEITVLCGSASTGAARLAKRDPRIRVFEVAGVGHFGPVEAPALVGNVVSSIIFRTSRNRRESNAR
jgi:pimeloyl-ACP methyl ester carboxylesterase